MITLSFVWLTLCCTHLSAHDISWQSVAQLGKQERTGFGERWDIQSGSFIIRSDMGDEGTLTCYFAFPLAKGNRESPRKKDVVYFFHTPNPKDGKVLDNGICNKLVRDYGMSVFGIAFKTSSNPAQIYGLKEKRHLFYAFAQSGSFRAIVSAWTVIRGQLQIERPDFFLYGYSAGAIGVQHFAEEFPTYAAGIVSVNGHSFVQKHGATCPHLIIHSFGDAGMSAGDGLQRYCAYRDVPCIRLLLSPKWEGLLEGNDGAFHAVNSGVVDLSTAYLVALADLRQKSFTHAIPPVDEWPYVTLAENPLEVAPGRQVQSLRQRTASSLFPMPSAAFYSLMLERPLPPRLMIIAEQSCYHIRSRPDATPVAQLLMCVEQQSERTIGNENFGRDEFLTAQYVAEYGVDTVILNHRYPLASVVKNMPRVIPVLAVSVIDPAPDMIDIGVPCTHVIVQFTQPTILEPYLSALQIMLKRGQKVLVLLPYTTAGEYDNATISVNPDVRKQIFPAFSAIGNNTVLSLHMQQYRALNYFLTGKLDAL
jgi:hypothetical protein